jgi:hypothetical protein
MKNTIPEEDKPLILELKRRGYVVMKREWIRTMSSEYTVSIESLIAYKDRSDHFLEHIYRDLGQSLGLAMMDHKVVPIIEEIGRENHTRKFRATATLLVDDPQFDWPEHLKEREKIT